jgi:hypothetical protein
LSLTESVAGLDSALLLTDLALCRPTTDQATLLHCGRWQDQPHQQVPSSRLEASPWSGLLIADEVGLGKTISAIIALRTLHARGEAGGVLIAVPGALVEKWSAELAHRADLTAIIARSGAALRQSLDRIDIGEPRCVITSHGILRRSENLVLLADHCPELMLTIIDEAHHCRNPKSRLHDAAQLLALKSKRILLLTATPINLSSQDLWIQLSLLAPDRWPDFESFRATMRPTAGLNRALEAIAGPLDMVTLRQEVFQLNNASSLAGDPRLLRARELLESRRPVGAPGGPRGLHGAEKSARRKKIAVVEGDDGEEVSAGVRKSGLVESTAESNGLKIPSEDELSERDRIEIADLLRSARPLNDLLVRTRRRDLDLHLAKRIPVILNVLLVDAEWRLYSAARRWSATLTRLRHDGDRSFDWAAIMPERMASSCLPAYAEHVLTRMREAARDIIETDDIDLRGEDLCAAEQRLLRRLGDYDGLIEAAEALGESDTKYEGLRAWLHSERGDAYQTESATASAIKNDATNPDASATESGLENYATSENGLVQDVSLPNEDSATSMNGLKPGINSEYSSGLDGGVLLFSQFHGTLKHLHQSLSRDGFRCEILTGRTPQRQRGAIRERFAQGEFEILLSSEVGSEGLDQQHCHRLVNYDLPWNPMRLEQRIGRLDRFGQKADEIAVVNLCVQGTIDAAILGRLLRRIRIFEESLGMIDPLLGRAVRQLASEEMQRAAVRPAGEAGHARVTLADITAEDDDELENILQNRGEWVRERALEERRWLGPDPGITALRERSIEQRLDIPESDFTAWLTLEISEVGGQLYHAGTRMNRDGSKNDRWMLSLPQSVISTLAAQATNPYLIDFDQRDWPAFIQRLDHSPPPHWFEVTIGREAARERGEVIHLAPWHPITRFLIEQKQTTPFAESTADDSLALQMRRCIDVPPAATWLAALEWRSNGLSEVKVRRWMLLDNRFAPITEQIPAPQNWLHGILDPDELDRAEIRELDRSMASMKNILIENERVSLTPLLDELRGSAQSAWTAKVEREREQLATADQRAKHEGKETDPRWIMMKQGLIRRLQAGLAERLGEIDRIEAEYDANLAAPLLIRLT